MRLGPLGCPVAVNADESLRGARGAAGGGAPPEARVLVCDDVMITRPCIRMASPSSSAHPANLTERFILVRSVRFM